MYSRLFAVALLGITFLYTVGFGLDKIPPASEWTEHGIIIPRGDPDAWDGSDAAMVIGLTMKDNVFYCYYTRGFRGCWEAERKGSHTSIGLATSRDGRTWEKHQDNPLMIPHDFVDVHAHEEGIRHAIIRYEPQLEKFFGYFGVEDPGGKSSCPYMQRNSCDCNISVDAYVYAAESYDGLEWVNKGLVEGVFNAEGRENYPRAYLYSDSTYYLWTMRNEGGSNGSVSSGQNPQAMDELKFGFYDWASETGEQCDAFLHDDGTTVSIIAKSTDDWHKGGFRIGTSTLDDITQVEWGDGWFPRSSGFQHGKLLKGPKEWMLVTTENDLADIVLITAPRADIVKVKHGRRGERRRNIGVGRRQVYTLRGQTTSAKALRTRPASVYIDDRSDDCKTNDLIILGGKD